MWTCRNCGRIFKKDKQVHSCKKVPLRSHFEGKEKAGELFDGVLGKINSEVGETKTISIPCCIHLFGKYDFIALLPKKDRLEIRFALNRKLDTPRLKTSVPLSKKIFKNVIDIYSKKEIDKEVIGWLKESYNLKN
jgi:hypothetical protein